MKRMIFLLLMSLWCAKSISKESCVPDRNPRTGFAGIPAYCLCRANCQAYTDEARVGYNGSCAYESCVKACADFGGWTGAEKKSGLAWNFVPFDRSYCARIKK